MGFNNKKIKNLIHVYIVIIFNDVGSQVCDV